MHCVGPKSETNGLMRAPTVAPMPKSPLIKPWSEAICVSEATCVPLIESQPMCFRNPLMTKVPPAPPMS